MQQAYKAGKKANPRIISRIDPELVNHPWYAGPSQNIFESGRRTPGKSFPPALLTCLIIFLQCLIFFLTSRKLLQTLQRSPHASSILNPNLAALDLRLRFRVGGRSNKFRFHPSYLLPCLPRHLPMLLMRFPPCKASNPEVHPADEEGDVRRNLQDDRGLQLRMPVILRKSTYQMTVQFPSPCNSKAHPANQEKEVHPNLQEDLLFRLRT